MGRHPRVENPATTPESIRRQEQVFHMYGVLHMTQFQIAEKLGITQPAVSYILKQSVKNRMAHHAELAEASTSVIFARHDDRCQRLLKQLAATTDPEVIDRLTNSLRKEDEFFAKLLGLYAPEKREVSGPNGGPISISNDTDILSQLRTMSPKARAMLAGLAQEIGATIDPETDTASTGGDSEGTGEGEDE